MTFDPAALNKASVAPMFMATGDVTVANTTTETTLMSTSYTGSGLTIPANRLAVSTTIQIDGAGVYTVPAVTAGTATIKVKLGGVAIVTAVASALVGGVTNVGYDFSCSLVCRATGTSGIVAPAGTVNFSTTAGGRVFVDLTGTTNAVIDTTVAQTLDITITWSAASASRTITNRATVISLLN